MKPVAEAVARWGDDWTVARECAALGDSSYAQDYRDAQLMAHLVEHPASPAKIQERRFALERRSFVRGLIERRKS
jgi:hypothetical protein